MVVLTFVLISLIFQLRQAHQHHQICGAEPHCWASS